MSMIFVIALLVLCGIVVGLWRFAANAAAILAVAGIVALAAWVTVTQVQQYHTQETINAENNASRPEETASSTPPLPPAVVSPQPMMNGLTGGAAPAVVRSPRERS
ncbi:MAG: hypothetical protein JO001_06550 [Alphaproteobacteria bacterium]|nr:hypothetical protein [Alphaproteobacteria bacterium]